MKNSLKKSINQLPSEKEVKQAIRTLLLFIGENPERKGLLKTPQRVTKIYNKEIFNGYNSNPEEILKKVFDNNIKYNEPILIKNISFISHCEHHMMPIVGNAHIAYLPNKKIVGLSKIPRIVDIFSRRLQVQEILTEEIANTINKFLQPYGVAVCIEAEHFCMAIRGIKKRGIVTVTQSFKGIYKKDKKEQFFIKKEIQRRNDYK